MPFLSRIEGGADAADEVCRGRSHVATLARLEQLHECRTDDHRVRDVRDRTSGHQLLGASCNVHASLNRVRFELRMGKHADRVLQAEWNRSGVDGLAFEVLELVKEREDADFDYAS